VSELRGNVDKDQLTTTQTLRSCKVLMMTPPLCGHMPLHKGKYNRTGLKFLTVTVMMRKMICMLGWSLWFERDRLIARLKCIFH